MIASAFSSSIYFDNIFLGFFYLLIRSLHCHVGPINYNVNFVRDYQFFRLRREQKRARDCQPCEETNGNANFRISCHTLNMHHSHAVMVMLMWTCIFKSIESLLCSHIVHNVLGCCCCCCCCLQWSLLARSVDYHDTNDSIFFSQTACCVCALTQKVILAANS